jgi:adenine-specific DNA-methyltransferase
MKYMGSKRGMLANGLGRVLDREIGKAKRFIDLFSGSSVVARHAACRHAIPVLAYDLQHYSKVLAGAVIARDLPLDAADIWLKWRKRAQTHLSKLNGVPAPATITSKTVQAVRTWSSQQAGNVTHAYGGHYYSAIQASWIDCLLATLPNSPAEHQVALASLIDAASQAAAAPGHTAQPFQPTRGSKKYLAGAWRVNIEEKVAASLAAIGSIHAKKIGKSKVADANSAARSMREGDLTFVDPPYSGVHYSRFYHVLETIAREGCGDVSGIGRYPPTEERPRSRYSLKGESIEALDELLFTIASKGARAIVTFPDHECSNGLSGEIMCELSAEHFHIRVKEVESNFSTLGGRALSKDKSARGGRQYRSELILILDPR